MYKPTLHIYICPKHRRKTPRLAGMLRGLLNSYDGFRSISGLTNSHFHRTKPVRVHFSSVKKAQSFKRVSDAVFGRYIVVRRIVVD